ncbi:MAG TPA: acyl-CoA synthetase [Mycobacteriales bacterium]|jgi:acyl-CoA synthetase (AMP-forming)/AMP-acid ligase II|nr:acyl-CoA synthetase [Mycobacteriales bacterium]
MNIADHAAARPDALALIGPGDERVTYGELHERAMRVAGLLHEAGLRRGDAVALMLPNRREFLEVTWGCQLSGLYYTPVNTHLTFDEVSYIVDDCQARALFIDASMEQLAADLRNRDSGIEVWVVVGGEWDGWQAYGDALSAVTAQAEPSDGCEMLYSSGTTGRPKGIRRPLPTENGSWAQGVLENAASHLYKATADSVYLSPAPLYHAAGVNYTMAIQRIGSAVVVVGKFDAEDTLRLIEKHRVTHAQFVPTMFVRMLKLPKEVRDRYDVSSLQWVVHAAAPCPVDVKQAMFEWLGPIIYEYYGGTEGFAGATIGPEEWLAHPGSVGRPLTTVHVMGEDGNELPVGEAGELFFEGGPAFEYWQDPEKTKSLSNSHGWRSLGDMGYVDAEGYVYLTDRATFMIVSGGVNIYPQETENLLIMHPKVVDAAVFGIPNDEFGEEVKAVVQPLDGVDLGPELAEELTDYCKANLAAYKCPRSIDFDPELPRDPNGKLYKRRIRDRYWEGRKSRIL